MMIRRYRCIFLLPHAGILAALAFALPSVRAQQSSLSPELPEEQGKQALPSSPTSPAGRQEKPKAPDATTREKQTGTSNERLFWVLPDFYLIENVKSLPPLSPGAKFKVCARSSFDYIEYPVYGLRAALSQAENAEPGYGRGAAGYGKRYGAAFADGTIEGFMTGAVLPSILRQDPRYYQLGKGSFWRRAGYAISYIFITRADSEFSWKSFSVHGHYSSGRMLLAGLDAKPMGGCSKHFQPHGGTANAGPPHRRTSHRGTDQ